MSIYTDLKKKIKEKKATITVIGLGYVGLPMAIEFCRKGFKVIGFDTSERRISRLKKKESYINDIPSSVVRKISEKNNFIPTTNDKALNEADVIIICVPTPLRKTKNPDISYIIAASRALSRRMRSGQLIIVESTTYPGTTREVILPELRKSALEMDKDFYLAFSPERIDPGNKKYHFANIPKVLGGFTKEGTELGELLYSQVVKKVVGVSSPEVAEVTKLLENTFRIVNLGLINEFANVCHKLNIDVWEVIKAAETKPFGFMTFYPGPGIGGHCIPADPMYLSWKARKIGFETKMIDLAAAVNRHVPSHIFDRVKGMLAKENKRLKNSRILMIGVTYKKDVNDLRESPALEIIKKLKGRKIKLSYHDPYIPYLDVHGIKMKSHKLTPSFLKEQDMVLIVSDHSSLNYKMIAKNSKLILDTRNVLDRNGIKGGNIVKL